MSAVQYAHAEASKYLEEKALTSKKWKKHDV
jgi:hypothetical protein